MGPMIERSHGEKVMGYIEAGKKEGAKLVHGGRRLLPDSGGFYIEATIFDGVNNSMKIAREEIFGPVLAVIPVKNDEEAVAVANDTNYGLAASLYSKDLSRAHRVARALRAGTGVGELLFRGRRDHAVRRVQGVRLLWPRQIHLRPRAIQ